MDANALNAELAGMDIALLDQVLKGRFAPLSRIVDIGCGSGRNLIWFARNGFETYALDRDAGCIARVQRDVPGVHAVTGSADALPWPDGHFQGVLCNALLHMLPDHETFQRVLHESWRVLAPGGTWFARLATTLSMESLARPTSSGRYEMPGGWEVLPTTLDEMLDLTRQLGGKLLDPIKTVNVQNQRAMATWVMTKPA
jgi:ubiquinone/menaquinone biosynthesis C-methylase UbiE